MFSTTILAVIAVICFENSHRAIRRPTVGADAVGVYRLRFRYTLYTAPVLACVAYTTLRGKAENDGVSRIRTLITTRCSTVSARYVRPSHLRCRWTNNMELVPNIDCFCRTLKTCLFERIRGAFCDDALYKLTFTLGVICCRSTQTV